MGAIQTPTPVLLVIGATSRYVEALQWTQTHASQTFGPILFASEAFEFTETDYYTATMGVGLKKQFLAFERLIDPAQLPTIKVGTNGWESDYATAAGHLESRPLNLDPGYITPAKLVLASTKDHAHRIYLADGIYAEVTLSYRKRHWQPSDWTYPDYRRVDFQSFFTRCRDWLLNCGANGPALR